MHKRTLQYKEFFDKYKFNDHENKELYKMLSEDLYNNNTTAWFFIVGKCMKNNDLLDVISDWLSNELDKHPLNYNLYKFANALEGYNDSYIDYKHMTYYELKKLALSECNTLNQSEFKYINKEINERFPHKKYQFCNELLDKKKYTTNTVGLLIDKLINDINNYNDISAFFKTRYNKYYM